MILTIDGFDLYNGTGANTGLQAKWTSGNIGRWSMVAGRIGGQAMQFNDVATGSDWLSRALGASLSSGTVGFSFYQTSFPGNGTSNQQIQLANGSTKSIGIRITTAGLVQIYRATGASGSDATSGTVLATSAGALATATWYSMEIEFVVHDSTGRVSVYIDNALFVEATGVDTNNGVTTVDTLFFGGTFGGAAGVFKIDDLYVTNSATRIGPRRVETIYPTSDVAQGFARSSGSANFSLVDEAQANGDTDYVQGSTVGDVDTYGFGDLATTPTAISAVQLTAFAVKTDVAARSIALQAKSGATTSDGSNIALPASYSKLDRIMEADPNTSAAWIAAGVNALQGGPKVTV